MLAHLGICNAIGESDPAEITKSLLSGELPQAKKRKVHMVEKIRAIPPTNLSFLYYHMMPNLFVMMLINIMLPFCKFCTLSQSIRCFTLPNVYIYHARLAIEC